MTSPQIPHWMRPRFWQAVAHMYEFCRKAEYPNTRAYSIKAGWWWARRLYG